MVVSKLDVKSVPSGSSSVNSGFEGGMFKSDNSKQNSVVLRFVDELGEWKDSYDWTQKIQAYKTRLCVNKEDEDLYGVIKSECSHEISKHWYIENEGDKPKPLPIPMFCDSQFCHRPECIEHRRKLAVNYFSSYMYSQDSWDSDTRWLHIVLGFPRTDELTREELLNHKKKLNQFCKKWKYHTKSSRAGTDHYLKFIGVRDISYKPLHPEGKYYVHYHLAVRPYQNCSSKKELKFMNDLAKEFGFKYNNFEYKPAASLISYFSKRKAGLFGHSKDDTDFMFKDIMTTEQYYCLFYKTKTVLKRGWSRKEMKKIKALRMKQLEVIEIKINGHTMRSIVFKSHLHQIFSVESCWCGCDEWEFGYWNSDVWGEPPPLAWFVA